MQLAVVDMDVATREGVNPDIRQCSVYGSAGG